MNIAYLVVNSASLSSNETLIRDELIARGHTITPYTASSTAPAAVGSPDAVLMSAGITSISSATTWRDSTLPVTVLGASITLTGLELANAGTGSGSGTTWTITTGGASHALANGLPAGAHTVLTTSSTMRYTAAAGVAPGATQIAYQFASDRYVYFGIDTDDALKNSFTANARRAVMMLTTTLAGLLSSGGYDFLETSLLWTADQITQPTGRWLAVGSILEILQEHVAIA
jgi:hypothetical protein